MFLSDELQNIYEESGKFNHETNIKILNAISNKLINDLNRLTGLAAQRGGISAGVVLATINNVKNAFNNFVKQHPDIPGVLLTAANTRFNEYHQMVYDICDK